MQVNSFPRPLSKLNQESLSVEQGDIFGKNTLQTQIHIFIFTLLFAIFLPTESLIANHSIRPHFTHFIQNVDSLNPQVPCFEANLYHHAKLELGRYTRSSDTVKNILLSSSSNISGLNSGALRGLLNGDSFRFGISFSIFVLFLSVTRLTSALARASMIVCKIKKSSV